MTDDERLSGLERSEGLVDRLPVGVFRSTLDGEFTDVNPAFVSLLGADSAEQVLAHHASEFYADPAARQRLVEKLDRDGVVTDEDVRITTFDGECVWVSATLMLRESDGERFLEGVTQDVTRRKERQRELQRYQGMVDTMRDSACIYDEDGRFVVINDYLAAIYGTTKEALVGEPSDLVEHVRGTDDDATPGSDGAERDPYERLVAGEIDELRGEYEEEFPDHGHSVVEYRLTRLTVDGEFEGVVGIGREVTDRKQRERQLERTNERLEAFSSIVSHDLRNPLGVAEGRLELARMECECDSEHLDKVAQAHDRMDTLIEDMLTLAREDEPAVDTVPVDLTDLAETSWGNVRTDDARLVTTVDATIYADRNRVQRLFENLFRNSVEHGSTSPRSQARGDSVEHGSASNRTQSGDSVEHGSTGSRMEDDSGDAGGRASITVTVGELADSTGFYVADDGPGIPPEDRDRVFESGYSTRKSGTGFGLSIVESIAEAHDWTVRVTEGDDGGARFEFTGVERAS